MACTNLGFMDSIKSYFSYESMTFCGIRAVKLLGIFFVFFVYVMKDLTLYLDCSTVIIRTHYTLRLLFGLYFMTQFLFCFKKTLMLKIGCKLTKILKNCVCSIFAKIVGGGGGRRNFPKSV